MAIGGATPFDCRKNNAAPALTWGAVTRTDDFAGRTIGGLSFNVRQPDAAECAESITNISAVEATNHLRRIDAHLPVTRIRDLGAQTKACRRRAAFDTRCNLGPGAGVALTDTKRNRANTQLRQDKRGTTIQAGRPVTLGLY